MSSASIFVSRITSARPRSTPAAVGRGDLRDGWRDLAREPLQRPVAAALDGGRHRRQRHDRPDLLALAGELERRDVALDAGVIRRQRGRADQLDRAVLAHQAAARAGGRREPAATASATTPAATSDLLHTRPRPIRHGTPLGTAGRPMRPNRTLGRRAAARFGSRDPADLASPRDDRRARRRDRRRRRRDRLLRGRRRHRRRRPQLARRRVRARRPGPRRPEHRRNPLRDRERHEELHRAHRHAARRESGSLDLDTTAALDPRATTCPLVDDGVTVEQLLAHRSGIGDFIDEEELDVEDYVLTVPLHTLDTTEAWLAGARRAPAGERRRARRSRTTTAATCCSRSSPSASASCPSPRSLDELVLAPAGLTATGVPPRRHADAGLAVGYLERRPHQRAAPARASARATAASRPRSPTSTGSGARSSPATSSRRPRSPR